jgi:predicted PurR-regulated permease PerM
MTDEQPAAAGRAIDTALRLGLVAVLIFACARIIQPFIGVVLWAILLAVMLAPLHRWLRGKGLGNARSATLIGLAGVLLLAVPAGLVATSIVGSIADIAVAHRAGPFVVPPPPPGLAGWPLVGDKAAALWAQAQADLPALLTRHADTVKAAVLWLVAQAGGIAATLFLFIGALALAAVLLAYGEGLARQALAIFVRATGDTGRGQRLLTLSTATVRGVLQGVVGVAFIQALLVGIGFFVAGVPFAGALTLVALILGILQVPGLLVGLPVIAWVWAHADSTTATIFTVWTLLAGVSDNILKPLMLGRGLEVPMPVLLVGVIGGMFADGLVGLFVGPVLLGAAKPVHILTPSATVRRIVNMTALTVADANAAR